MERLNYPCIAENRKRHFWSVGCDPIHQISKHLKYCEGGNGTISHQGVELECFKELSVHCLEVDQEALKGVFYGNHM